MNHVQIVKGDYVITPCKNAFNSKTSYWISKRGWSISHYIFTPMDDEDLKDQLSEDSIKSYIAFYEHFLKIKFNSET